MMKKFLFLALALCAGVWSLFGEDIPSSVTTDPKTMNMNQSSDGNNNGFTNETHWTAASGGDVITPQTLTTPMLPNPAAVDTIYVVPNGKNLRTYKDTVANHIPGAQYGTPLLAGGKEWHLGGSITPATDYSTTPLSFPKLFVYDGSALGVNTTIGLSNTAIMVKSSSSNPFTVSPPANTSIHLDRCTFSGKANTVLKFRNATSGMSNLAATFRIRSCDFTDFAGELQLNWPTGYNYAGLTLLCEEGCVDMPAGTLSASSNVIVKTRGERLSRVKTMTFKGVNTLQTGYSGCWQIEKLVLTNDTVLSCQDVTQNSNPFFTVTTTLDRAPGAVTVVSLNVGSTFTPLSSGRRIPVLKLNEGVRTSAGEAVVLSGSQFQLVSSVKGSLSVETAQDGSQTLWYTEPVMMKQTDSAGKAFTNGTYWVDNQVPHGDAWYVVPTGWLLNPTDFGSYTFPGLGIWFETSSMLSLNGTMTRFFATNIVFAGNATLNDYTSSKTFFPGKIVLKGGTLTLHEYSMGSDTDNGGDVFSGEVSGSGKIVARWRGKNNSYGRFEMTGTNVNYLGKLVVCCNGWDVENPWGSADYTPMSAKHLRVVVTDQRNLGGPIPAGATTPVYDALTVRDRQILHADGRVAPNKNVVFDDATRGIYVPWWGRFRVDANATMTIKQQVTYEGRFQKIGAGTLALGGTARFTKNGLTTPYADATFLAGTNVLDITEGALKPLSTEAFAGVAVVFSNATQLVLDPNATGDLATYGLKVTAAGSSVSVPNGTVTLAGLVPTAAPTKIAVATFATSAAAEAFKAKLATPRLRQTNVALSVEANAVEASYSTVYATVGPLGAFLFFR